jgi:hypothetical protein
VLLKVYGLFVSALRLRSAPARSLCWLCLGSSVVRISRTPLRKSTIVLDACDGTTTSTSAEAAERFRRIARRPAGRRRARTSSATSTLSLLIKEGRLDAREIAERMGHSAEMLETPLRPRDSRVPRPAHRRLRRGQGEGLLVPLGALLRSAEWRDVGAAPGDRAARIARSLHDTGPKPGDGGAHDEAAALGCARAGPLRRQAKPRRHPQGHQQRIATLADTVDLVALTDNHAGEARLSPLAAVALALEQGVRNSRSRLLPRPQSACAAVSGRGGARRLAPRVCCVSKAIP